ncbi:MAG TPA: glycosyltransferase family 4 protein [Vicinamibacterales bacterium]|nr:glycosyltransferase family 4 protein [Vicinamibacterales bacterium]
MRVTMLVRCLAMMRGGGETRHLAWARELSALGVDVEVITGVPLLGAARYRVDEVPATLVRSPYTRDFVYRFQNRRGFGRLTMTALHVDEEWFCRAAWRHIAASRRSADVVHAHAIHQAARLRVGDMPVVINLPGPPNRRYVEDLRLADALIADGWAADHLPAALGRPVDRVPKGVDVERFRPDGPSQRDALGLRDRRIVIAVARLVPLKNLALLIDAAARLQTRIHNLHLLIVGDGPEADALRRRAAGRGVADRVTFAGDVPHAETPSWFRSADVFALSSRFDNSPNAVLEAMATGLPIVATDVGGVREFVADGSGGALVADDDPEAMAAALERYLTDTVAARTAGTWNRNRAMTEFSWRRSAQRLLDVYARVVAARRGAARATA